MKKFILITLIALLALGTAMAQSSPDDPAIIKAKEETAVVFDLGRLFGYINTMVAEEKNLSVDILDLRNSGDTAGDKNRVVGYGAYVFH